METAGDYCAVERGGCSPWPRFPRCLHAPQVAAVHPHLIIAVPIYYTGALLSRSDGGAKKAGHRTHSKKVVVLYAQCTLIPSWDDGLSGDADVLADTIKNYASSLEDQEASTTLLNSDLIHDGFVVVKMSPLVALSNDVNQVDSYGRYRRRVDVGGTPISRSANDSFGQALLWR